CLPTGAAANHACDFSPIPGTDEVLYGRFRMLTGDENDFGDVFGLLEGVDGIRQHRSLEQLSQNFTGVAEPLSLTGRHNDDGCTHDALSRASKSRSATSSGTGAEPSTRPARKPTP